MGPLPWHGSMQNRVSYQQWTAAAHDIGAGAELKPKRANSHPSSALSSLAPSPAPSPVALPLPPATAKAKRTASGPIAAALPASAAHTQGGEAHIMHTYKGLKRVMLLRSVLAAFTCYSHDVPFVHHKLLLELRSGDVFVTWQVHH